MNALPNAQTNGITSLLQGNFASGNTPQAGMNGPNPLQQLQQAQQEAQQNKPAQIAPDLAKALALQKTLEEQQAAQRQMALQQQPKPPVVQQLQQKLQPTQQVPQQPGMPGGAPQRQVGGSGLPTLPSGIGNNMAGGGIVSFAAGGTPGMTDAKGDPYTHLWHAEGSSDQQTPYWESLSKAFGLPIEMIKRLIQAPNQEKYQSDIKPAASGWTGGVLPDEVLAKYIFSARNGDQGAKGFVMAYAAKNPAQVAAINQRFGQAGDLTGVPEGAPIPAGKKVMGSQPPAPLQQPPAPVQTAAPQPMGQPQQQPAGGDGGIASLIKQLQGRVANPEQPQQEADPFGKQMQDAIQKRMGASPTADRNEAMQWYQQQLGMDKYAADQEARIKQQEQLMQAAKAKDDPFMEGLLGFLSRPTASFGQQMANLGRANYMGGKARAERDLANNAKLMEMRGGLDKAQMEARKAAADKAMAAGEVSQRGADAALTAGTSLAGTQEAARGRVANAAQASADRNLQMLTTLMGRQDATAERADQAKQENMQQYMLQAAKNAEAIVKQEQMMNPSLNVEQRFQEVYTNTLRKLLESMGKAPAQQAAPATNTTAGGWSARIKTP